MAHVGHPRFLLSGSRVRRMRDEERYAIDLVGTREHAAEKSFRQPVEFACETRVKCKRSPRNRVQLELLSAGRSC
jgi:hypothetical protein